MRYSAFCFDIDGTLLDSQGVLRPPVVTALERLSLQGASLLVATAVPQRFALTKLSALPFVGRRGVFLNGAHVLDQPTAYEHTVQLDVRVTQPLVQELMALDPELQILIQLGPDHHALRTPLPPDVTAGWGYPPDALVPFEQACSQPCAKIVAWHEQRSHTQAYHELQARLDGRARMFLSEDGREMWVTSIEADKGLGLLRLLDYLKIDPAEVVVFGDDMADLDMFQIAGTSVAMGNAPEQVKAAATYVAPSCDQEGVAHALAELLSWPDSLT